jgi:hypothetical protein
VDLGSLPNEPRLVIFNQNAYKTFAAPGSVFSWQRHARSGRIEAILVVSEDNAEYTRYAFPGVRVERIRNSIDDATFYPGPMERAKRIAVMPRRRASDWNQVQGLLTLRGCLKNWDIVPIASKSEQETAEILRSCAIFLSFSEQEGFGMPPAEAMACGCYVIGFTGLAGREFFSPDICAVAKEGDVLGFAKEIERGVRHYEQDPAAIREAALTGAARIRRDYSPDIQLAELKRFYESLDITMAHEGAGRLE